MAKATTVPDTHVLRILVQEYQQMLAQAQGGIERLLSLDSQEEAFWDQLSDLDPIVTLIESRSNSIHEEIDELVDRLPED